MTGGTAGRQSDFSSGIPEPRPTAAPSRPGAVRTDEHRFRGIAGAVTIGEQVRSELASKTTSGSTGHFDVEQAPPRAHPARAAAALPSRSKRTPAPLMRLGHATHEGTTWASRPG